MREMKERERYKMEETERRMKGEWREYEEETRRE